MQLNTSATDPVSKPPTPSITSDTFEQQHQNARRKCTRGMLHNRSLLLGYLLKLKRSIDAEHLDLVQAISQRFVEHLTDYISFTHFRWLESSDAQIHQIVAIQNNTCEILDFTEFYTGNRTPEIRSLQQQLERLALALEVRFEIEDEIVRSMS